MRLSLLLCVFLCLPLLAGAQFIPSQPNINITTSPRSPEPNETITVALDAYTIDTAGASITWFVDGVEVVSAKNNRSFGLNTKGLGEETVIRVQLKLRQGPVFTEQLVIRPSRTDIVIEANTLVPGFYQGRALPSTGSTIRAIAIPSTSESLDRDNLTYLWKLENKVLFGGPVTGKSVAELTLGLGKNQILSVDISDANGQLISRKSILLEVSEPELHFYADNPLRGLIPRAIQSPYPLVGDEITVRAEPYYMDRDILRKNPLLEWKLNGRTIANPNVDQQNVILRRNGNGGVANVRFHIRNLQELVQGVEDSFSIQF